MEEVVEDISYAGNGLYCVKEEKRRRYVKQRSRCGQKRTDKCEEGGYMRGKIEGTVV